MKIGILADTHDNLITLEKAVQFLNAKKVDLVLHAGDFIAPFTIPRLKALSCDYKGVFGNNDGEKEGLRRASGGKITNDPLRFEIEGKKITVIHDLSRIDVKNEDAHLIVCGHTHKPQIVKEKAKLLLNPGECGGWLYGKSTFAIVALEELSAEIFEI